MFCLYSSQFLSLNGQFTKDHLRKVFGWLTFFKINMLWNLIQDSSRMIRDQHFAFCKSNHTEYFKRNKHYH